MLRWDAAAMMVAAGVQIGSLEVLLRVAPANLRWGAAGVGLGVVALAYLWGTAGSATRHRVSGVLLALAVLYFGYISGGSSVLMWVALAVWGVRRVAPPRIWVGALLWTAVWLWPVALGTLPPYGAYVVGVASVLAVRLPTPSESSVPPAGQ